MLTQLTEHSADQFGKMFSLAGSGSFMPVQESMRNVEAIVSSTSTLAQALDNISRAWLEFAREQTDRNLKRSEELINSRSPQAFFAVEVDLARDNVEGMLQMAQRVAELSLQVTSDATRKLTVNIQQTRREAA